jgi:hypothetical protein
MNSSTTGRPRIPGPVGSAAGFAAGIVATIIASGAGAIGQPGVGLAIVALAVAAVSALTTVAGALATAAQCWLLYAGFIMGRSGNLVLNDSSLEVAGLFGIVALATSVITSGRFVRARISR